MNIRQLFIIVVFLVVGFIIGVVVDSRFFKESSDYLKAVQVRQGGYAFINPLLECEIGQKVLSKQFVSFRYAVEKKINELGGENGLETMSVYFRDLNNGLFFGINQNEGFSPASLLKLPIMIAYYKEAEDHPEIFQKKLGYRDETDRNAAETFRPKNVIQRNKEYSVDELIYRMMVSSDNNAMALLVEDMPLKTQDKVFRDLRITIPGVRGTEDFMSVSEYASFFRILYNASYLSQESSERALKLLSAVDFADGLRAGVPKEVRVANKFGERSFNDRKQLHDCGIVYYEDHPYLLCIMSRGTDFRKLASSIQTISALVYQEVDKQVQAESH